MKLDNLSTPSIILNLDALENNIKRFHGLALENNKEIWPMIKTHKSSEILKIQKDNGASGVLCGTLDECEASYKAGFENIMYAYPVSDEIAIQRIIKLSKKCNFIIRIDNFESAKLIDEKAKDENVKINYSLIINCGLNRFGIDKENTLNFLEEIKEFDNLILVGISSHPGHVYSAKVPEEVEKYVNDEVGTLKYVKKLLNSHGYNLKYISSGSTPTFLKAVKNNTINVFHPGNYVFLDAIQISLGICKEKDCALRVLASVISNPRESNFMLDAGAKCLGLDQGAHGNDSIKGHGIIIGHENALIESLSEEVGKVKDTEKKLRVGERIQIIPNHSCSTANLTNYFYAYRNNEVEKIIEVDIRGNSKKQILE
ncbi:alanine racemase [Anaerococcus porci]|uniref:alanine racemase n=1 Tax=Anaerococcus porci TaxID=2652269 RepID=UPI002A759BC6|nr:alanine racemase [Anaerococcus porci]MDY3006061.1 alanine racemase [Anaerococcus porci]